MQELEHFVPAISHDFKPALRDGSQFAPMSLHPRVDGRIAFDSSVESQQLGFHRRSFAGLELWYFGMSFRCRRRAGATWL
jgi:hypothetical protein